MEDEIWGDRMEQILLDIETVASLNSGKLQPDEVELYESMAICNEYHVLDEFLPFDIVLTILE